MSILRRAVRGAGWVASASYLGVVISFAGNLALARLLFPADFGVYALATSLLSLVTMLGGFGSQEAIIQFREEKNSADVERLIAMSFWTSCIIGFGIALIGTCIGLIASHYYDNNVSRLVIILSWTSMVNTIALTYAAILQRDFNFKPIAVVKVLTGIISFGSAAVLASQGWGVWSLAAKDVIGTMITLLGMIWAAKYRPIFAFDRTDFLWILSFGWRMMVSRISEVLFGRVDNLVVGTFLGTVSLGYYSQAYRLALLGHQFTHGALSSVIYSSFAHVQKSSSKLQYVYERIYFWLPRFIIPLGIIVWLLGKEVVVLVYGTKWEEAGIVLEAMAVFVVFAPLSDTLKELLVGVGRIDTVVRYRVVQLGIFFPTVIAAVYWGGLNAVVWSVNLSVFLFWLLLWHATTEIVRSGWKYLLQPPLIAGIGSALAGRVISVAGGSSEVLIAHIAFTASATVCIYGVLLFTIDRRAWLREFRILNAARTANV